MGTTRRDAIACRSVAAALLLACGIAGAQEETTSSVLDGVYTETQAANGAQAYGQSCALCHGASLGGIGEAPALVGGGFISDFNGLSLGDLFERMRTSMPLNNPGGLSRAQYSDILAFVLKSNGFPSGTRELYQRTEFLNVIRFEAPRSP